jgi:hypothetical protein
VIKHAGDPNSNPLRQRYEITRLRYAEKRAAMPDEDTKTKEETCN